MLQTDIPSIVETMRQALRLNPDIFAQIQATRQGIFIALTVVALAAFSEALGQSMVLFLNRVRPRRFVLSLLIATLSNITGYLLWTVTVWLVGRYLFGVEVPVWTLANAVGLAYTPQVLAFFELTPFFGNTFGIFLSLWSMLAIIVAIQVGMGLELWQAALTSLLGWLLIQAWRRSLGRPIYALGRFIERRAAGVPMEIDAEDVTKLRLRPPPLQNWQVWLETRRRVIDAQISSFRQAHFKGERTLPKPSVTSNGNQQQTVARK